MTIRIVKVDFSNEEHCFHLVRLLDGYARDPMGGKEPLPEYAREHLIQEMKKRQT